MGEMHACFLLKLDEIKGYEGDSNSKLIILIYVKKDAIVKLDFPICEKSENIKKIFPSQMGTKGQSLKHFSQTKILGKKIIPSQLKFVVLII